MTRRALLAAASVAAVLAAAPAAHAGPAGELTEASGAGFPRKTFVLTLAERRDLRPSDVSVRENGAAVDGLQIVPGDAAGAKTFATVLVIDTSQSMRGAPIDAAMAAARQFAAHRPPQQRLGVIFFNRTAAIALAPTTDAAEIARVLASPPPLSKGTRLYDATALALRVLADTGSSARSVVVLSDGADVASNLPAATVAEGARHTKTRVFSVGLRSRSYEGSSLRGLAGSTGGLYAEADERQLARLFAGLGRRFGREFLVSYRSLAPLSTHVDVRLRIAGISGAASGAYTSPAYRAGEPAKASSRAPFLGSDAGLGVATALVALLCGAAAFVVIRPSRRTVPARVAQFTAGTASPQSQLLAVESLELETALVTRRRAPSRRWAAFAEDVDVAGLRVTPERIAAWTIAATFLVVVLALLVGSPVLALLALPAPLIVRSIVSARANQARRQFDSQLADNLQVVASAMRAGQSFVGALAVAVEDALEPAKRELHRAVTDERLGVPLDEALGRAALRMRSEELEYVGQVATLQRETGGNTADVVDRVTQTIRERAELKRLVRGLTAQGRLGGAIVSAIPPSLAALFMVIKPGYFAPLLESTLGLACIAAAVVMLAAAWIAIRKIVDIKV